jgi:flagellar protein FliL
MADDVGGDDDGKKEKKGNPNLIVTVLVLLNTVLIGVIGFFQKTAMDKMNQQESVHDVVAAAMKEKEKKEDQKPEQGIAREQDGKLFTLEGFTANLAQGDGPRRFIRLNAVLKFTNESNEEEYKRRGPQIRDTIIGLLNSKRPEDLLKREGKNFLKEEVRAAVNAFLVEGKVIDVYYVNFQIN